VKKICTIIGNRPQFIKWSALTTRLRTTYSELVIHTGQHYDRNMSGVFFEEMDLPAPDYNLGIKSNYHGEQTGEMLKGIEEVLLREKPDCAFVYGDTNSTLAGALAAAKLHVPVAHVEAGLRSFNKRMPEEINRVATDHVSTLLFCPTETAVKNLAREGITEQVHLVGDLMNDAMVNFIKLAETRSDVLQKLGLRSKEYFLATIHRAENTDDPERIGNIMRAFNDLAGAAKKVVFTVHPRTRKIIDEIGNSIGTSSPEMMMIDPVPYFDMLLLEKQAKVILTDSGGVQKEAYWLKVPCVTIRDETEWVETIEQGWNVLSSCEPESIVKCALEAREGKDPPAYGNGKASDNILKVLESAF